MGIGHALLETLPLYENGPGNGTWNVNRYDVARARDVPVWNTTVEILSPITATDPPKGMAEIVMIPVLTGVINAIHDAVGVRSERIPVTADHIMKAL